MKRLALAAVVFHALPALAGWEYQSDKDEMRGTVAEMRYTKSLNKLDFAFPYQGGSGATLIVRRKSANAKTDVIVDIEKGQLICTTYSECEATVKFDDGKPQSVGGSPSDNSRRDVVFLGSAARLIEQMKKAKTMFVELKFYKEGRHVYKFDVTGLEWPPGKQQAPPSKK